jgi:hypothetical protein
MNVAYATEEERLAARRETWRRSKRMKTLRAYEDNQQKATQRQLWAANTRIREAQTGGEHINPEDLVALQDLLADHQGPPERRQLLINILAEKRSELYPHP